MDFGITFVLSPIFSSEVINSFSNGRALGNFACIHITLISQGSFERTVQGTLFIGDSVVGESKIEFLIEGTECAVVRFCTKEM